MILIWLVGAAFLYWPFRKWVATRQAPLISALLWPLMIIVVVFGLIIAFFKKGDVNNNENIEGVLEGVIRDLKQSFMFTQEDIPESFIEAEVWKNSTLFINIINSSDIEINQKNEIFQQYIALEWFKSRYGERLYKAVTELSNLQVMNADVEDLSNRFSAPFQIFYQNNNEKAALTTQIYRLAKSDFFSSGGSLTELENILKLNGYSEELISFYRLKENESKEAMLKRQNMSYKDYDPRDHIDIHVENIDMHEVNYLFNFITGSLNPESKLKVSMSIVQGLI